jgi:hypothetical protein
VGVPGIGEPGPASPVEPGAGTVTAMALITAAGTSLLALGTAPLVHGLAGPRRAIGLVLVTQAVLLLRIGFAGPAVELEEIAREGLLVVAGATGAALAIAAAGSAMAREDAEQDAVRESAGETRRALSLR